MKNIIYGLAHTVYLRVLVDLMYKSNSILNLLGAVLYKLYPVTFGNDNKSYQNKSHNEITAKLVQKWHNFRG